MGKLERSRAPRRWPYCREIVVRGRRFSQKDLVIIRGLIRRYPHWGRTAISVRVCEELGWRQPNGRLKDRACRVALLRLENMGYLRLPERKVERGGRPPHGHRGVPTPLVAVKTMPDEISITRVGRRDDSQIWNSAVSRYHYLGLATPVGRLIRYLIYGDGNLLGGISFSECAWSLGARDYLLANAGIPEASWRDSVINNNRFLILPSVEVPNLASRILAAALRQVRGDWMASFGADPVVAETFVDPARYSGTCYVAANWLIAGTTRGFAKRGALHVDSKRPKVLLLRGLTSRVHRSLEIALKGLDQRAA